MLELCGRWHKKNVEKATIFDNVVGNYDGSREATNSFTIEIILEQYIGI